MFRSLNNKAFIVGGAVRDLLLGHEPKDRDYVIECTKEEFEKVFPDAECVGNTFPVYLHPETGDEIALTRTERLSGSKYQDFEVTGIGVSIYHDLRRRDFTINSIAQRYSNGEIVDPYEGQIDLKQKVLRCVNPDAFSDDPLRIYRGARFVSRFDLCLDSQTLLLMYANIGNLINVERERVVNELKKVYSEGNPVLFFRTLHLLGALKYHFAPLDALTNIPAGPEKYHGTNTAFDHTMEVIGRCKEKGLSFDCFIACLFHDTGKGTTPKDVLPKHIGHENRSYDINKEYFDNHRFDTSTKDLALTVAKNHMKAHAITNMRPITLIKFFRSIRRFDEFLQCCDCDHSLSPEQIQAYELFKEIKKSTPIEVPKNIINKDEFVSRLLTKEYTRRRT